MKRQVTLVLSDEQGQLRHVVVDSTYFTVGRGGENDLSIKDGYVSNRHVVIAGFADAFQIADCGSRNGTLLNGKPIAGAVELSDGDVITLGPRRDVLVRIGEAGPGAAQQADRARPPVDTVGPGDQPRRPEDATGVLERPTNIDSPAVEPGPGERPPASASHGRGASTTWHSTPMIAAGVVLSILAVTGILVSSKRDQAPLVGIYVDRGGQTHLTDTPNANRIVIPASNRVENANTAPVPEGAASAPLERAAVQVMDRISNDTTPYTFQADALEDIETKIGRYKASAALPGVLRDIRERGADVAVQARRAGIEPDLVFYAALAETDGGQTGQDTLATARELIPDLQWLRATFGSETADSSLLVIAAYKMGGRGTRSTHELFLKLRSASANPSNLRSVWYLHERGSLDAQAYDYVLRFLAIGAIAQNPRLFGIDAAPLAF